MTGVCSVCTHPDVEAINLALVARGKFRELAARFGLSKSALCRHADDHLPAAIVKADAAKQEAHSLDLMGRLTRQCAIGDKVADACERYLTDPEDPTRFDVGPRSSDVTVVFEDGRNERTGLPILRKARLDTLLARVSGAGVPVVGVEARHADPRELVVKLLSTQTRQTELLAKVLGKLNEGAAVDVLTSPQWSEMRGGLVRALEPFPEAAAAVADLFLEWEANGSPRN
jgi:hypothetical protein